MTDPAELSLPSAPEESPPTPVVEEEEPPQVMMIRVGVERLAVPLGELREVLRARAATRVSGTPPWVTGLVTVRGALVPVADLSRLAGSQEGDAPWLVVVERDGRPAGLGVTAVEGVETVDEALDAPQTASATLPRRGAVRLLSRGPADAAGDSSTADVLDVGALFEMLFDGD
jgi:chemotaxis signal transduction protein